MQRRAALLVVFGLISYQTAALAQKPAPGSRLRITTDRSMVGELLASSDSALTLRNAAGDTFVVHLKSIEKIELSKGPGQRWDRAAADAGIGALAGAGFGLWAMVEDSETPAWFVAASTAFGGLVGGAHSVGGDDAAEGALIGGIGGAVVGAAVGVASYEDASCGPDSFLCFDFGPGLYALGGAVVGAGAGVLVGSIIGALSAEERWTTISADRFRVKIAGSPMGTGLIASYSF